MHDFSFSLLLEYICMVHRHIEPFYMIHLQVMLLGDSGVGKTCVLVRFKDGAFLSGSFISTVGIDYKV